LHKILIFKDQKTIKMETKQTVDSILETVRAEISLFVDEESAIKCPIEYELRLLKLARNFAKTLLEETQGQLPKSRNSKKKSKLPLVK